MALLAPSPPQQGYELVVTPAAGGADYSLVVLNTPQVKRTATVLYDTVDVEVDNGPGGRPIAEKDVVRLYKDGVLELHGLVVGRPSIKFTASGQVLRFTAASRPFLLWKKRSRDWDFTGIDDAEALGIILGLSIASDLPFASVAEFTTFTQVQLVANRLQLGQSSPGVFYPSGTAVYRPAEIRGEINKLRFEATISGSRIGSFSDPITGPTAPSFVNAGLTTALYYPVMEAYRLQDRVTDLVEPFNDFAQTVDYQNVLLTGGAVVLAGITYEKLFSSQASWDYLNALSLAGVDTIGGGSTNMETSALGDRFVGGSVMRDANSTFLYAWLNWTAANNVSVTAKRWNEATSTGTVLHSNSFAGALDTTRQFVTCLFEYNGTTFLYYEYVAGVTLRQAFVALIGAGAAPALTGLAFDGTVSDSFDSLKILVMPDGALYAYHTRVATGARTVKKYNTGTSTWSVVADPYSVPGAGVVSYPYMPGPYVSPTGQYFAIGHTSSTTPRIYIRDGSGSGSTQWIDVGAHNNSSATRVNLPISMGNTYTGPMVLNFPADIGSIRQFGYFVLANPIGEDGLRYHLRNTEQFIGGGRRAAALMLDTGVDFPRAALVFQLKPHNTTAGGSFSVADGRYRFQLGDLGSGEKRLFYINTAGGLVDLTTQRLMEDQDNEIRLEMDHFDANQSNWTCRVYIRGVDCGLITACENQGSTLRYLGRMAFWAESMAYDVKYSIDTVRVYPRSNGGDDNLGYIVLRKVLTYPMYRAWVEAAATTPAGTAVAYEVSPDDGASWYPINPSSAGSEEYVDFVLNQTVNARLRITLTTTNASKPSVQSSTGHLSNGYLTGPYKMVTNNLNPDPTLTAAFVKILPETALALPAGATVTWRVSANGGVNWTNYPGPLGTDQAIPPAEVGNDVRIEATLATSNQANTPQVQSLAVQWRDSGSGTTLTAYVSRDGGANYHAVADGQEIDFTAFPAESPKNRLVFRFDLATTVSSSSPSIQDVSYEADTTGYTWFRLGDAGTDVVGLGQDYPLRAYYQKLGVMLEDLVRNVGVDAWWELDRDSGVYVFHYNVERPGQDASGVVGVDVLEVEIKADGLKSADRWFLIGQGT